MYKMLFFTLSICLMAFTNPASAIEKKLDVQHFWQDDGCWCGVAVVEMVEQYYRGPSWRFRNERQADLAKSQNNGGVKVGNTSDGDGRDNPCGKDGGVNTAEMLTMLNYRLGTYGKRFEDGVWSTISWEPKKSSYFHYRVMQSINNNDPFIFAGHTRYRDGSKKYLQHWYLIIGYQDADGDPRTITSEDGYYIHDASVGAGLSHLKTLGSKGKFVSHFNMVKYIGEYGNKLYPIAQKN